MIRFAMMAADILFGMLSVVLLIRLITPNFELETLISRFVVYTILLLIVFRTVDCGNKDVTGPRSRLLPSLVRRQQA